MHGPLRSIETRLRPRCGRVRGAALGSAGLPGLHGAVAPRQGSASRAGQAMPRGRQRAVAAFSGAPCIAGLEIGRRDSACEGRAAGRGVCFPDGSGLPAEQSELVRGDLAQARQGAGLRPGNRASLPARGLSQKRCPLSVSRTREGLHSSVSRTREALSCSVSRSYQGHFCPFLCSVSRTPSRDAICGVGLKGAST